MKYLADYFECSTREVKDYIELTPKKELAGILDNFKVTTSKKEEKRTQMTRKNMMKNGKKMKPIPMTF
jgi:hypothetical protein